jgi:UDP-N-acetylmuramate--alanine ligase
VKPLFVESTDALPSAILAIAQDHDVIIVMGAGSIGQVAAKTRTLAMEGV